MIYAIITRLEWEPTGNITVAQDRYAKQMVEDFASRSLRVDGAICNTQDECVVVLRSILTELVSHIMSWSGSYSDDVLRCVRFSYAYESVRNHRLSVPCVGPASSIPVL